jgi:hypothetical protein
MSLVGNKMGCWTNKKRKKIMSLVKISNIIQRSARTSRLPTINPRSKWLSESLETTMDAVERSIIVL